MIIELANNTEILLSVENIGKSFFGNVVLSDVSFTLKPGEIIGLVERMAQASQH